MHTAISMATNVASFALNAKDRGLICATKIIPKILFGSDISPPAKSDLGKVRSAVTRAVWKKRSGRSADVVLSLVHPVHRIDPFCAWVCRCLIQLRRMCLRRPDIKQRIYQLWQAPCTKSWFGPVTAVKSALSGSGMTWNTFETFSTSNRIISWLSHSRSFFQHQVRQTLREKNLLCAHKRSDLCGINNEVDRCTLDRILHKLPNYARGTFAAIVSGGFRSAIHFQKVGLVTDPTCPFCGQCDEDIPHIFLDCPAWASIRLKFPIMNFEWLRQAPPCTKFCAVPLVPQSVLTFPNFLLLMTFSNNPCLLVPGTYSSRLVLTLMYAFGQMDLASCRTIPT